MPPEFCDRGISVEIQLEHGSVELDYCRWKVTEMPTFHFVGAVSIFSAQNFQFLSVEFWAVLF